MGLETGTFVSDLVATNPLAGDKKSAGDDHLRLIKELLRNTFPNAGKAFYFPTFGSKTGDFVIASTEQGKTFSVDTSAGNVIATLPSLSADDDGWCCHFIKNTTDSNVLFIEPDSGTLQSGEVSGLARCRRCIPGHKSTATWTGTGWMVSRVIGNPIGSTIELTVADLPVGYEWPNGQTLASASTNYPEFYAKNGNSGVTHDQRGRISAAKDDMGGTSANRLTGITGSVDGDTLGASGGLETNTLTELQMPIHDHSATSPPHAHAGGSTVTVDQNLDGASEQVRSVSAGGAENTGSKAVTITVADAGGGEAHPNVQPTIVENKILVVE